MSFTHVTSGATVPTQVTSGDNVQYHSGLEGDSSLELAVSGRDIRRGL